MSRTRSQVIQRAVIDDNIRIRNRYLIPATAIIATTATLITGYQAYRFAKRQKSLDQESEMSHIERLEVERAGDKKEQGSART